VAYGTSRRETASFRCLGVAAIVACTLMTTGIAIADTDAIEKATGLHLLDSDAKVVAIVEVSRIMETPFGKQNLEATLASPQGQQFIAQVLEIQRKYGVNVLQDVYRVTLIAPFTDGEPFADVLFAVDARLNKHRIEQALASLDGCPAERHAGCLIFEVTNGTGKFFCSALSDSLFVVSIDKRPIAKAIDRAAENMLGTSKRLADAINALPGSHMAWAVADSSAFSREEQDWVLFRKNAEWFSVGVGIAGPVASLDATFQAPNEDAAVSLEALLVKYLKGSDTSPRILGLLPAMIQPTAESISVTRQGARVSISAVGL
jgi:hypothetical protein